MRPGTVVLVTGLPAAGKSTLAEHVAYRLRTARMPCLVLDGDAVRAALGRPAGQGEAERDAHYATLARLAALAAKQGMAVLVPATAPRKVHREVFRALAPRLLEVLVATPPETCAARDPKGLWAAARRGEAPDLPGATAPYEPPAAPDVTASGGDDATAIAAIMERLAGGG